MISITTSRCRCLDFDGLDISIRIVFLPFQILHSEHEIPAHAAGEGDSSNVLGNFGNRNGVASESPWELQELLCGLSGRFFVTSELMFAFPKRIRESQRQNVETFPTKMYAFVK